MTNIHPLLKQIGGAMVGAALSLALYGAYQFVGPMLQATLASFAHAAPAQKYTDEERADRQEVIAQRAKDIIAQMHQD